MRLDQYKNKNGSGKYAIVNLRKRPFEPWPGGKVAIRVEAVELLSDGQFFVIKATDCFAREALRGYMKAVSVRILHSKDKKEERSLRRYLKDLMRMDEEWAGLSTKLPD